MAGVPELRRALAAASEEALNDPEPDNPVYRAAQTQVMREVAQTDDQRFLLDRLDRLEELIRAYTKPTNSPEKQRATRTRQSAAVAVIKVSSDEKTTEEVEAFLRGHPFIVSADRFTLPGDSDWYVEVRVNPRISQTTFEVFTTTIAGRFGLRPEAVALTSFL